MRNRCLAALAARRSLPVPSEADFASLGDDVGLGEALAQWERTHAPVVVEAPQRGFDLPPRPIARWRSPFALKAASLVLAAFLGFAVGERFLPQADAQSSSGSVEPQWLALTDSVAVAANQKLSRNRARRDPITLSAADVAALTLKSPRRAGVIIEDVEARAVDSLIVIRGRLAGDTKFELHGELRMPRRGVGELRVLSLVVDGMELDPSTSTRLVSRSRSRSESSNRIRFELPTSVTAVRVHEGAIELSREQKVRSTKGPAVRQ